MVKNYLWWFKVWCTATGSVFIEGGAAAKNVQQSGTLPGSLKIFGCCPKRTPLPRPHSVRARKRMDRPCEKVEMSLTLCHSVSGWPLLSRPGRSCNPDHAPGQAAPTPKTGRDSSGVSRRVGVLMTPGGCIALAVEVHPDFSGARRALASGGPVAPSPARPRPRGITGALSVWRDRGRPIHPARQPSGSEGNEKSAPRWFGPPARHALCTAPFGAVTR